MSAVPYRAALDSDLRSSRRSLGNRVRRAGLSVFFASVGVNAALGIYAVLTPDFGDTEGKILRTSLCVTGAILVALACEPAWERKLLGPVPYAGAVLGLLGFALAVIGIWAEVVSDVYGKVMVTTFVAASAFIVASLLALARLADRHRWVFAVTLSLLALGATMLATVPWLGDDPSETYLRAMGAVLIALAAFAVTVPVLHWVDRSALAVSDGTSGAVRYCPHCGKSLTGEPGVALACNRCGRGFTVSPNST
jgi:hypothetical protein